MRACGTVASSNETRRHYLPKREPARLALGRLVAVLLTVLAAAQPRHAGAAQASHVMTFSTANQSLWGPGAEKPGPQRRSILSDSWNTGGSTSVKHSVSGFGTFGGSFSGSTSGNIATSINTTNFGTGSLAVNYPVQVHIFHPDPDNFRPGDFVRISATQALQPGGLIQATAPSTGTIGLNAQAGLTTRLNAEACVFGCASFPMFNLNFRPPELPVVQIPMGNIPAGSIGAGRLGIINGGPGSCAPDQIEVSEASGLAQKTGVSGCLGSPDFQVATTSPDGHILLGQGADPFMFISLDLDNWLSKIKGAPKFGVQKDFRAGRARADAIDIDLNHLFTLSHVLRFDPNILITLTFPNVVSYIHYKFGGEAVPGLGSTITFAVGESIDVKAPEAVIPVGPQYVMDSSFENDTTLTIDQSIRERVLFAEFGLGGINLFCTPPICSPWGSCCCNHCVSSPSVNFGLGPVYEVNIPTKVFRDSSLLDRQRPAWQLQGFNDASRAPFILDPNFFPVPVLEGPPTAIEEGADAAFSAAMSFDPDDPVLTYTYDFGDGGTGRGPTSGESVIHNYGDNGVFTVTLFASDGFADPVPTTFEVTITNVAPQLSDFVDQQEDEGDVVTATVTLTDPGFLDTYIATFDWGDGSTPESIPFPAESPTVTDTHVYGDNGTYTVGICVEDDDGAEGCGSLQATIDNVAPTISVAGAERTFEVFNLGEGLDTTCRFAAPFNDKGTMDSHTARVDWGDGDSSTVDVFESPFGPPGATIGANGLVSDEVTHRYAAAGNYDINVCVMDDDGAETCTLKESLIVPEADLVLTRVAEPAAPGPVGAGTDLRFHYTITNNGPDSVDMVELIDRLPRVPHPNGTLATTLLSAKSGKDGNSELKIPPGDLGTRFGHSWYGASLDKVGDTLAIGAPGDNDEEGAVYVFARVGEDWTQEKKIGGPVPFIQIGLGTQVSLSSDEQTLAVGAAPLGGAVHPDLSMYFRDGGAWVTQAVSLTSTENSGPPAIDTTGNDTVAVGTWSVGSGAVVIVERVEAGAAGPAGDTWTETQNIAENPPSGQVSVDFGRALSISGQTLAVVGGEQGGDPTDISSVSIFVNNGTWQEEARLTSSDVTVPAGFTLLPGSFGRGGVALDGDRLAISSGSTEYKPASPTPGSIVIFERSAGVWSQTAFLIPLGGIINPIGTVLPAAADIELDGDSLAVGGYLVDGTEAANSAGNLTGQMLEATVFLFLFEDGVWTQRDALTASIGTCTSGVNAGDICRSDANCAASECDKLGTRLGAGLDVEGEVVYAGAPFIDDISNSGPIGETGTAFEFKICDHRAGVVTCGLGTLASGESAGVDILARVGCVHNTDPFQSVDLVNDASVQGNAIDTDTSNNSTTDTHATAVAPQGVCGQDRTAPVVVPIVSGTLGDNGWYVSDVTVDWDVSDPDSPITSTTGCNQSTVTSDTAGVTFTCAATHTAANAQMLTTTESVTIKRDATAPTISPMTSGTVGDDDWFISDVGVSFDCADAMSGIDTCTPSTTLTTQGINPTVFGSAVDLAGNLAMAQVGVKIDKTPPTIIGVRTPANPNGWNAGNVTVEFTCSDSASGIVSCTAPAIVSTEGAGQSRSGTARNGAGLEAMVTVTGINIDKTAPAITTEAIPAANANGWNNSGVEVSFNCSDALSGIDDCSNPVALATEGSSQAVTGTATDLAGNQASAATTIHIDATPPTISASAAPSPAGDGITDPPVTVTYTCDDGLSGLASCSQPSVLSEAGFGQLAEGTATDLAGNSATAEVSLDIGRPGLTPGPALFATEGSPVGGTLGALSAAASTDGQVLIDWGDEIVETAFIGAAPATGAATSGAAATTPLTGEHIFADDGTYTVEITVNSLSGDTTSAGFDITIDNAPPAIDSLDFPATGATGAALRLIATFSDPGSADTHSARVEWGDGRTDAPTPDENPFGPPGAPDGMSGSIDVEHTYQQPGTFDGELCITDDDGAEACASFSIEIERAGTVRLGCAVEVLAVTDTPTGTEAEVRAHFFGDSDGAEILWSSDTPGVAFDDHTAADTTVRFDIDFDKTTPLLLGFIVGTNDATGQPVFCQAACGTSPSDQEFLGTCLSSNDAEFQLAPAPAVSTLGLALSILLIAAIAATALRRLQSAHGIRENSG